jgi:hypothetical protein
MLRMSTATYAIMFVTNDLSLHSTAHFARLHAAVPAMPVARVSRRYNPSICRRMADWDALSRVARRAALLKARSVTGSTVKKRDGSGVEKKFFQPVIVDVRLHRRGGKVAEGFLRMIRRHIDRELALLLF